MHETALMENLIASAMQALENRNVVRVNSVSISVGKLANLLPAALLFAFEAMTQDGLLKGAVLEIEQLPIVARCDNCGNEYEGEGFPFACPACKNPGFMIIGGEEVYLKSIDFEEG